jgi:hypothetical protein
MNTRYFGRAALSIGLLHLLAACAVPAADERFSEGAPDRAGFAELAQVLVRHCGTLDCHGSRARKLRVYGNEGLRWADSDQPLSPACTTQDEIEQDYASLIGLEPELMTAVVAQGGAHPERLTLVRKARGAEHHKGGAPFHEEDDADRCLTSWLGGDTQIDACLRALPPTMCFAQP